MLPRRRGSLLPLALALGALVASAASADAPVALVGSPLPEARVRPVSVEGGDARALDPSAHRGRVLLVGFFATWCHTCTAVRPLLEDLARAHADDGLSVLLYSHQPRAALRRYLEQHPTSLPVAQCTGRTALSFGATAVPTLVLADREGVVRHVYQSGSASTREALARDVGRLLASR